jgi:hypothetical protein
MLWGRPGRGIKLLGLWLKNRGQRKGLEAFGIADRLSRR